MTFLIPIPSSFSDHVSLLPPPPHRVMSMGLIRGPAENAASIGVGYWQEEKAF